MATTTQARFNTEHLEAATQSAIESDDTFTIVGAKERVEQTMNDLAKHDPAWHELARFLVKIDEKLAKLNDGEAKYLVTSIKNGFEQVRRHLQAKELHAASQILREDLQFLGRRIKLENRWYMKEAIQRISKEIYGKKLQFNDVCKNFDDVHNAALQWLGRLEAEERVERELIAAREKAAREQRIRDAIAGKVDHKEIVRAKDLLGRFWANVKNSNPGTARTLLWDIKSTDLHIPLLSIQGSVERYEALIVDMEAAIKRLEQHKPIKKRR